MSQPAAALELDKSLDRSEHYRVARRGLTMAVALGCLVGVVVAFQRWGAVAGAVSVLCTPVAIWLISSAFARPLAYLMCGQGVSRMSWEQIDD